MSVNVHALIPFNKLKKVLTSPISVIKACMEVIKAEKIMKKATTAVSVAAADQSLFFSSS